MSFFSIAFWPSQKSKPRIHRSLPWPLLIYWENRIAFVPKESERKPIGGTEALNFLKKIPATTQGQSTSNGSATGSSNGSAAINAADRSDEQVIVNSALCHALSNVREFFTEQSWRAFWMVVVDGRETADVAKDLGMQAGAVRVAKSRVLKRLRLELGDSID